MEHWGAKVGLGLGGNPNPDKAGHLRVVRVLQRCVLRCRVLCQHLRRRRIARGRDRHGIVGGASRFSHNGLVGRGGVAPVRLLRDVPFPGRLRYPVRRTCPCIFAGGGDGRDNEVVGGQRHVASGCHCASGAGGLPLPIWTWPLTQRSTVHRRGHHWRCNLGRGDHRGGRVDVVLRPHRRERMGDGARHGKLSARAPCYYLCRDQSAANWTQQSACPVSAVQDLT